MGIIEDIKLVWENGFFLSVILFFIFLIIAIFFLVLAILDIAEKKTANGVFSNIFAFFIILILLCHLAININANNIRKDALKKQEAMKERQRKNHTNKMCFVLDASVKSDLKKDDLAKEKIYDLSLLAGENYWSLIDMQEDYYEKNKTSDGFSNNKDFTKIYSAGYQNLLKIKEEIDNRRLYCFKNYCNDIYYNKSDDDIEVKLGNYIKLQCNKGDKND